MSSNFGRVVDLRPGKSVFGLELRLIHSYTIFNFRSEKEALSMECVFHDREGQRVHVTIQKMNMEKYKDSLTVGHIYALIDYVIGLNQSRNKTTDAAHRITVIRPTRLFQVFDVEFPKTLYQFKSFVEIKDIKNADIPSFDVIGAIVSHYKPQMKEINGKQTKLMDVLLEDVEGNTITVTLWENFADMILAFLATEPESPVIIILQFCRPNIYRGEVKLSNTFNATKIITDVKDADIMDYTTSYMTAGKVRASSVSVLTTFTSRTIEEEIKDGDVHLKSIAQIKEEGKVGQFWVFATIVCVEDVGVWCYLACKNCMKKLLPKGNQFFCERCQNYDVDGKLRYKLSITVVDHTDTSSFLLWDKESMLLIGRSAAEIKTVDNGLDEIPAEIESLAERKVLFNINVVPGQTKDYRGSYTVARICVNHETIEKICGFAASDEGASASKMKETISREKVGSSSDLTSAPKKNVNVHDENKKEQIIFKTIRNLLEDEENGVFWIKATVAEVDGLKGDPYLACKVCDRELSPEETRKIFCEKCQSFEICAKTRHILPICVVDETARTIFNIRGKDSYVFYGKTAEEFGDDIVPNEIDIDKISKIMAIFKVVAFHDKPKKYYNPYTVVKIVTDAEEMKYLEDKTTKMKGKGKMVDEDEKVQKNFIKPAGGISINSQDKTSQKKGKGKMEAEDEKDQENFIKLDGGISINCQDKTSKQKGKGNMEDDDEKDQENFMKPAGGETPKKRELIEGKDDEAKLLDQFSTTQKKRIRRNAKKLQF